MENNTELIAQCEARAKEWLSPAFDEETRKAVQAMLDNADKTDLIDAFYQNLEFGTGGLRGIMGAGTNRMNKYIVGMATQGFANYILKAFPNRNDLAVVVGHDCRNNGRMFAETVADIFSANGIKVYLFESLRPTPEISFAIRQLHCQAGVNVTASHNPREYNGYKAYWDDGAQVLAPHDKGIIDEVNKVTINDVKFEGNKDLIEIIGGEMDWDYLQAVKEAMVDQDVILRNKDLNIVYSPMHGTGRVIIPEALRSWGFQNIHVVPEQMVIDGNFPTVVSPNPENPEGFYLAIDLAKKNDVDFILGTDPDSDRVGIMVRDGAGKFVPVTGNQTGVLMADYLIGALRRSGRMPEKPYFLKSIVTTDMARAVCEANGVTCCDTFTGFKFMAEKKNALQAAGEGEVIMSYEESYGYMLGDFVRDKDAVTASLVLTEMAAWYAARRMTLFDALHALYEKYGWYGEKTHNLVMPGLDGLERMAKLMKTLRQTPPTEISGLAVRLRKDYQDGSAVETATGKVSAMELSGSNVLRYELADGTSLIVRPSGTEPKIKVYILTKGADAAERDENIAKYSRWVDTLTHMV